jgi:cytochrome c biogenesis protein CcmG/thiol:disulfide interchange protein DsbE
MSAASATRPRLAGRRLLFLVPLALFALLAVFFRIGLTRDPSTLPSALVGKPAPEFALPPIEGRAGPGFARSDLGGRPMLVNVFASWCVPCRVEHPMLAQLAEQGVVVHGINYKDRPEAARAWLAELGDPFTRIGADRQGRVAIDWGVYGVPETFVVDRDGNIVHRHVGPLQASDVERTIRPLLGRLAP